VRRPARIAVASAAGLAGAALGALAGRQAVRRARGHSSPERLEQMDERPGRASTLRSFDGTELAVHVVGPDDAPTLVFAHGFSIDLTAWYFQWRTFAERYRCVLYDQRGHGRSARPPGGDYTVAALGEDLKAVLDAEVPDGPAALIGHSMGGMAVLSLAERWPEEFGGRVRAVVLSNTAAGELALGAVAGVGTRLGALVSGATARLAGNPRAVARVRARAFAGESTVAWAIGRLTNFGPHADPALVDHVIRTAARTPAEVWSDLFVSLLELDLRDAVEHIRVPALVLAGDVDRLTPPAGALAIKRALPDARMTVFRGSGHCTMLERHEQWNQVVGDFLAEFLPPTRSQGRRRSRAAVAR
jgi:pimeloyl-ACP methyl ester carboxylesterase